MNERSSIHPLPLSYPISEAFAKLRISAGTGQKLLVAGASKGGLDSFYIGRRRFVSDEELRRFIRDQQRQAPAVHAKWASINRAAIEKSVAVRAGKRAQKQAA